MLHSVHGILIVVCRHLRALYPPAYHPQNQWLERVGWHRYRCQETINGDEPNTERNESKSIDIQIRIVTHTTMYNSFIHAPHTSTRTSNT